MSRVISFRLCRDNPREAQALEMLQQRQEQGFSTRQILLEALLSLSSDANTSDLNDIAARLEDVLNEANDYIARLQNGQSVTGTMATAPSELPSVSEGFKLSVRKAAKSGVRAG